MLSPGRGPWPVGIGAALIASALALTLCVVAPQGALGASPDGGAKRLILSPHPGQRLPARPLLIRLNTGEKKRDLRVRLNGDRIGKYFSGPSRRGIRRLRASASFGLRHGRNRLRVRARGSGGQWRSRTLHFRVRRNRPLAGAGFDRRVAVGARVHLNGRRSRTHLSGSGSGATRSPLHNRWKIVRGPGGRAGASPRGASSPRAHFSLARPGRYVVRLRVRAKDGKVGSDLVEVRADPVPAAAVDTMASGPGGATGIQVGAGEKGFYPAQPRAWAQLVALDRQTLAPVTGGVADLANKSYPCPAAAATPVNAGFLRCVSELTSDLKRLDSHDLAIVSNQPSATEKGTPGYGLEQALAPIGVHKTGFDNAAGLQPGSISAIGVPSAATRQADWNAVAEHTKEGAGRMRDYLVRNNEGQYVFAPSDPIEFNTQAKGSDSGRNVIELGDRRFDTYGGPFLGRGGLQVVVADRRTLAATSQYFPTSDVEVPQIGDIAPLLRRANDGSNFVFVASRGDPSIQVSSSESIRSFRNSALRDIADEIERLGGTRNGIFRALDPGLNDRDSYTLLGWSHAGAGQAVETLGGNTTPPDPNSGTALNSAPLVGTLARTGPNYAFAVESSRSIPSDSSGADPSRGATELTKVAFQLPSAWPERGNAGRTAAIGWIGKQVFGTDDPRGQYWTVPFVKDQFDYAYWTEAAARIGKLDYPNEGAFTDDELGWAKAELQREIGWLVSIHRYLDNLATPFAKGALQSWADFEQIADSVRDKVDVSRDQKVRANAQAVFDGIRELVDVIPGPQAKGVEAANAIYNLVVELIEINGEPAADDFQARADEIGVKLAERLSAAQGMLDRQLPNVISADYEKLKTVGQCTSSDPQVWASCPFDHGDWQYTQDDQASAAKALRSELQIAAYGSLLPAKYTAYQLPLWWRTKVNDDFYGYTALFTHWVPFSGLPGTAQMAKPVYRNIPTYSHSVTGGPQPFGPTEPWKSSGETWQITALGYLSGDGTIIHPWVMHYPEASVTDRLFKTGGDGLGLDPETFFDSNFTPKPLDHYPERDTPTGWCAHPQDPCGG
jgi:hypothetical protein